MTKSKNTLLHDLRNELQCILYGKGSVARVNKLRTEFERIGAIEDYRIEILNAAEISRDNERFAAVMEYEAAEFALCESCQSQEAEHNGLCNECESNKGRDDKYA